MLRKLFSNPKVLIRQFLPDTAQAFWGYSEVGGYHPLRDAQQEIGVHFNETQIAFFRRCAQQKIEPFVDVPDVVVQ